MKTSAWIVAAGLALGINANAHAAPSLWTLSPSALDDKADLTPRYTTGQVITFKQHTMRTDTFTVLNFPILEKPQDKPVDAGKEPAKSEPAKADPAKPDASKADAPKSDPARTDPAKPDATKAEPTKSDPANAEPPKTASKTSVTTYDQIATYEARVTDAGAPGVSMDLELKAIVCTAEIPSGKFTWDSATPADEKDAKNPVLMSFRPIVGATLKVKIGPDGNITSVEPDSRVSINGRSSLAPMIQQLVGADSVRLRFGSLLWIKDGREAASIGKPWTNTDELYFATVGKFVHVTSNTLKSVKDDAAQIDIVGEIKLEGLEPGKPPAGELREQSLKGSCVWDLKAGLVKSHIWVQKTTLSAKAFGAFDALRTSEVTVTTTRE